ncbi:Sec-independent protein translocase TatA [Tindallia magadiensis]|uniref:Sec-independent protein translocase protein TatA n=1 Tax=Tindallia magadiensis TaxID=69895 RepID=A0A1I3F7M7_9FIRM|nr:twin-arginine translocase TatA/TatE family subunit [Tindallia magadiensis]SFI07236.1 Sec-independent protein translocase TatA [Tindallia magadiensis]
MGRIGFQELALVFGLALLIFGPAKLPEIGKSLGKGIREFKSATIEKNSEEKTENKTKEEASESNGDNKEEQ